MSRRSKKPGEKYQTSLNLNIEAEANRNKHGAHQNSTEVNSTANPPEALKRQKSRFIVEEIDPNLAGIYRHVEYLAGRRQLILGANELNLKTKTQGIFLLVPELGNAYCFTTTAFNPVISTTEGKNLLDEIMTMAFGSTNGIEFMEMVRKMNSDCDPNVDPAMANPDNSSVAESILNLQDSNVIVEDVHCELYRLGSANCETDTYSTRYPEQRLFDDIEDLHELATMPSGNNRKEQIFSKPRDTDAIIYATETIKYIRNARRQNNEEK
ncbi:hypothetical protein AX774_g2588 [Zancudomyces culisetae]|uniref:Uncharacterized protein n=1 Tax=Zancudomyces culisetae TaxID=1213189 RepID=A0A1R1PSD5_ZANCU|nr:hypothetical protein AX774_g2588 [Zancudomyces culisetae]|eukprot:OMH83890.1 hypothetical protein AX774_g2588 [Zancudomyces culisetae]